MIITIYRQCGCGGHVVVVLLAEKLGLELYDTKKLLEESKKSVNSRKTAISLMKNR